MWWKADVEWRAGLLKPGSEGQYFIRPQVQCQFNLICFDNLCRNQPQHHPGTLYSSRIMLLLAFGGAHHRLSIISRMVSWRYCTCIGYSPPSPSPSPSPLQTSLFLLMGPSPSSQSLPLYNWARRVLFSVTTANLSNSHRFILRLITTSFMTFVTTCFGVCLFVTMFIDGPFAAIFLFSVLVSAISLSVPVMFHPSYFPSSVAFFALMSV